MQARCSVVLLLLACRLHLLPSTEAARGHQHLQPHALIKQHSASITQAGAESPALTKIRELVEPYGYPLEQHYVKTGDNYILGLHNIPPKGSANGRVVLLGHGLLDSAAGWLVNGPGCSLAFLLADAGYDIWLVNWRGNTLSRNHTHLDPEQDAAFWAFSYDEMARHDLPETIAYIRAVTGASALDYVGHSQGTTVALAALAHPAVADYVAASLRVAVLLAPVAVAKHLLSVPLLAMAAMDTDGLFDWLGFHEFMPSLAQVADMEGLLCRVQPYLCASVLTAIAGYNPDNINMTRLPLYLSHTPAGTSVQNMVHWAQAVRSRVPNSMAFFDYGSNCGAPVPPGLPPRCNYVMYGTDAPPTYNLTRVGTRVALFTGGQDILSTPIDVEYLIESLPPGVLVVPPPTPDSSPSSSFSSPSSSSSHSALNHNTNTNTGRGARIPPSMDVRGGHVPTSLVGYLGKRFTDVQQQQQQQQQQVVLADYSHLDFIWGADAPQRLYAPVMQLLLAEAGGGTAAASAGTAGTRGAALQHVPSQSGAVLKWLRWHTSSWGQGLRRMMQKLLQLL